MVRQVTFIAGLLVAVLILAQLPALAQNANGSISGTVADSSGAVVPNAQVVLKNEATETTRDSVSNGSGFFNFAAVPPATYTITVTASGFNPWEERGITMTQGAPLSVPNIALQVGSTKSEVQVVAANDVIVPTDNGQASTTLNQHMISQISIGGRDAAELIKIMPGMGPTNGLSQHASFDATSGTANNTGPIGAYSANGTQPNGSMTMTSDGANLLDPGNQGTQTANINADQTQEVTLLTSAYGAEFAKGPVTFQAIGKSGSAQFHGQAYMYARNGVMNSEDSYLKNQGIKKPLDHYYYPGGDFGGPVLIPGTKFNHNRDKLFFYSAFEYMWQQQAGSLINRFIPTPDMMAGNFSPAYLSSLGQAFKNNYSNDTNPLGGNGGVGTLAPGGMIPSSLLDPNSNILWKTMPKPNADPTTNSSGSNFQYLVNPPQNRWELRLRGDYNISDNTKFFFSWNRQDESDQSPLNVWWSMPGALPYPSNMLANQQSNVYSANLTHVFSPTLTNEFIFADATFLNPINLATPAAVNPSKLGFQMQGIFSQSGYTPQIPNFFSGWAGSGNFGGYSAYTFGDKGFSAGFGKLSQAPNVSDNITKVWGTHTIKGGFYWDFARNQQTAGPGPEGGVQGTTYYDTWGATSSNNPVADFVLARATEFYQNSGGPTEDFKYYQYSFYVQDAWKAGRRLTLTYGLRFDHMGNWFPSSGPGLAVWDPATYVNTANPPAWTGLQWHAINSSIPISGFPSKAFFPEPRIGVAYDLFGNGKTVIRGGYGQFRYQLAYNSVSGGAYNDPLGFESVSTTWGCCLGWENFNQYSPATGTPGIGTGVSGLLKMGDNKTPWTETYNVTISQRVPWNSLAEFQYSGNRSHDMLLDNAQENQENIPIGTYYKPDPITGVLHDPALPNFPNTDYNPIHNYTQLQLVTHGSYSNYNAFIGTWQKQTGRVTFTANYTFSKALGIRDGETDNGAGQGVLMDPFVIKNNYGVLGFDHTHLFNAAYIFNLPSPVHGNKFAGGVVNGWELSGITQFSSGAPIQPNAGGAMNVVYPGQFSPTVNGVPHPYSQAVLLGTGSYPNSAVYPVVICDPRKGVASGYYFNPACFAPDTTQFSQGTLIWPYIKGPAYFDSDLSLYKNFNFKERQNVQFRFQTYNFLNHPLPEFNASGSNNDLSLVFNQGGNLAMTNQNTYTTGKPLNTVGRRVVMLSLKYTF